MPRVAAWGGRVFTPAMPNLAGTVWLIDTCFSARRLLRSQWHSRARGLRGAACRYAWPTRAIHCGSGVSRAGFLNLRLNDQRPEVDQAHPSEAVRPAGHRCDHLNPVPGGDICRPGALVPVPAPSTLTSRSRQAWRSASPSSASGLDQSISRTTTRSPASTKTTLELRSMAGRRDPAGTSAGGGAHAPTATRRGREGLRSGSLGRASSRATAWGGTGGCNAPWLSRFLRLSIRYEPRADIHLAFMDLGCAPVRFNTLQPLGSC
jgi:hypothetical protein